MVTLPDGTRAHFVDESGAPPPDSVAIVDDTTRASDALRQLRARSSLLWTGDFRNARHLLTALRRRLDRQRRDPLPDELRARWHAERAITRERGELLSRLLVRVEPDGSVALRRAPDTRQAVEWAWGPAEHPRLIALTTLLGALSAAEWTRRGLEVPGLDGRLTPRFGVFSPTRHAYLKLLDHLVVHDKSVIDVGCGTGVLGLILLQRGASQVSATDIDDRAVACATHNAAQLGLSDRFHAVRADLFVADQRADLVVFNPPWVPEVPRTRLDRAVFDPDGTVLRRFVTELPAHLGAGGAGALFLSDLPERLGLRADDAIERLAAAAGLVATNLGDTPATHRAATRQADPLLEARSLERIRLIRLRPVTDRSA